MSNAAFDIAGWTLTDDPLSGANVHDQSNEHGTRKAIAPSRVLRLAGLIERIEARLTEYQNELIGTMHGPEDGNGHLVDESAAFWLVSARMSLGEAIFELEASR